MKNLCEPVAVNGSKAARRPRTASGGESHWETEKAWTGSTTVFDSWETDDAIYWHVEQQTREARLIMSERRVELGHIIDGASEMVDSLKEVAAELKRNPSMLIRERRPEPLEETR